MSTRQRGSGWQVDVNVNGTRWRGAAPTQEDAIILEARVRADLLVGKVVPTKEGGRQPATLAQLLRRTHDRHWAGSKSEKTVAVNCRAAVAYFGPDQPITGINSERVDEYIGHLQASGNSGATINRKTAVLSKALRYAHQLGWLEAVPHLPRQAEPEGRHRQVTREEEARLINLAHRWSKTDEADLFEFLIDTGLRLGEALKLEWDDLAAQPGSVVVSDTKNKTTRKVPLTRRVQLVLARRANCLHPFGMSKRRVQGCFERLRQQMGLADDHTFVIHALRHTFASRLVQAGVPLLTVSKLMGHKGLQITMRYAYLAPENFVEAIGVLEQ